MTTTDSNQNETKEKQFRTNRRYRATEYYNLQGTFDDLYADSTNGKSFKHLMEIISSRENILLAYRNLKSNSGSITPGVNNHTIEYWKSKSTEQLVNLVQAKLQNYVPNAVKRVYIPKANGKLRPLGIPTIEDRLVQQCIKQVLEPICEAKFHPYSFGFRPNRSTEHAIAYFMRLMNRTKCQYVVDVDIKGFFDNVNHSKLLKQCWTLGIKDKNLLSVLKKCLTAPVQEEIRGVTHKEIPKRGTPQGGILSPLLSNIVLNELDWWVANQWQYKNTKNSYSCSSGVYRALRSSNLKEGWIVRYADDFKICCKTKDEAIKWYHAVKQWLKERLGLEISETKSKITNLRKSSSEFLGFRFKLKSKGNKWVVQSWMTNKAKKNTVKNLKDTLKTMQKESNGKTVNLYNSKVLGKQQYYSLATNVNLDMNDIQYKISKTMHNRLRNCGSHIGEVTETYKKYYKEYNYKKYFVDKRILFPIGGIKHKKPQMFNQNKTPYSEEGRKEIHKNLECVSPRDLEYIILNPVPNATVEYNDNRVSLYTAQWGECAISGLPLSPMDMECHHVVPRSKGGTDKWKNLILVLPEVHKLIHATVQETIDKYMENFYFKDHKEYRNFIRKINKYRTFVGNNIIIEK